MKPSFATRRIYKMAQYATQFVTSGLRTMQLRLIWDVRGRLTVAPGLTVRSVSGDVTVGNNVVIGRDANIECAKGGLLWIGDNCTINQGTFIVARRSISIGHGVLIGEYCSIRDNDHEWGDSDAPISSQGYRSAAIRIGNDVWLGRGVAVQKGVTIGDGAIVGANAVVTHDVLPYTVVAGVPARPIKTRKGQGAEVLRTIRETSADRTDE